VSSEIPPHRLRLGGRPSAAPLRRGRIEPSAEAKLEFENAKSEIEAARKGAELLGERVKMKPAAQQDLVAAQQRLGLAERRLESLKQRDSMMRRGRFWGAKIRKESGGVFR